MMNEQLSNFELHRQPVEPSTVRIVRGEEVFSDTSDPGEGDFTQSQEPFTGYDAATSHAPVRAVRTTKTVVLKQPESPISHPIIRRIKIVEFTSRIPLRNPASAA